MQLLTCVCLCAVCPEADSSRMPCKKRSSRSMLLLSSSARSFSPSLPARGSCLLTFAEQCFSGCSGTVYRKAAFCCVEACCGQGVLTCCVARTAAVNAESSGLVTGALGSGFALAVMIYATAGVDAACYPLLFPQPPTAHAESSKDVGVDCVRAVIAVLKNCVDVVIISTALFCLLLLQETTAPAANSTRL